MSGNVFVLFIAFLLLESAARGSHYPPGAAYQHEDDTCYHMVLLSRGMKEKELLPYASKVKSIHVLHDGHFEDEPYCIYKKTFGYTGSYVWVDGLCRARFVVCYELGIHVLVLCNSEYGVYQECLVPGDIIRIEPVKSNNECKKGETYGFKDKYVWVKDGCEAAFRVTLPHKKIHGSHFQELENFSPDGKYEEIH